MKIHFIHHSSFLVELEHHVLLFDYFDGARVKEYDFGGMLPEMDEKKDIYVFASHKHRDHFDMDNLKLANKYPKVQFVFSKDCRMSPNFLRKHGYGEEIEQRIIYVAPNKVYQIGEVAVYTILSTDAGVAFCVEVEGKWFYHAGDLHWWHWEQDTEAENIRREKVYKREIKKLSEYAFDVAFVPLDSRQGTQAFKGFDYFVKNVKANRIIPMHMWRDYSLIERYVEKCKEKSLEEKIVRIYRENQEIEVKEKY